MLAMRPNRRRSTVESPSLVDEVRRIPLDPSDVTPGSTLQPIARFVLEREGAEVASVVFGRAEIFEHHPVEYALARFKWAEGQTDAARAVMTAAAQSAPDDAPVYFQVGAAVSSNHADRRAVAEASGFEIFQEKEGFWWPDGGENLPESGDLRWQSMASIGRAPFIDAIGRCLSATLDRSDILTFPRSRPEDWAENFLKHDAKPEDEQSWLFAETADGEPIGFVGVSAREVDPEAAVLNLIGVLPEQRGHRYVDQLIYAAYREARRRGFKGVMSFVDVENHPMMAAARRSGGDPDASPWHKWLYVSSAVRSTVG